MWAGEAWEGGARGGCRHAHGPRSRGAAGAQARAAGGVQAHHADVLHDAVALAEGEDSLGVAIGVDEGEADPVLLPRLQLAPPRLQQRSHPRDSVAAAPTPIPPCAAECVT